MKSYSWIDLDAAFSRFITKRYFLVIAAFAAFYVFFLSGYLFYCEDQVSQIPTILRFFDKQLYQKDYAMQFINPFAVKMIPHLLLFLASKITMIPVHLIYFTAYCAIVYATLYLTFKISYILSASYHTSLLACLLVMFYSNSYLLISSIFKTLPSLVVPYFIAVPAHLVCFYLVLRGRYLISVFLCGLLFYIHGQISLFTILPILIVNTFFKRRPALSLKYAFFYIALISPALLGLSKFISGNKIPGKYSISELIAFRMPYLFPDGRKLMIFIGVILCIVLMQLFYRGKKEIKGELRYWNYSLIFVYLAGALFACYIPVNFIMLLYCPRVDVFLRIFFFILASMAIRDILGKPLNFLRFSVVFLAAFLGILFFLTTYRFSFPKITMPGNEFVDISRYVKSHTPKQSLFITPPFIEGFRLYSERSAVVDFKTHPIGRGAGLQDEWMDRLLNVCNVKMFRPPRGWAEILKCKRGYDSLTREDFLYLCDKYKADYFIAYSNAINARWHDILVYKNSKFALFSR
jgi:hypothetical protein